MVKNDFLNKNKQYASDVEMKLAMEVIGPTARSSEPKSDLTAIKTGSDTHSYFEYHNYNSPEEIEVSRKPTTYYANAKIFSPEAPRRFPRTTDELSYTVFDDE